MYFCTNLVGTLHWPQRQVRGRLAVVIKGTREDWPGGARTLTPRYPTREPNGTFWFGAELPAGDQVWFRIAEEAIGRMPEKTPRDRGARLVDALIVWIADLAFFRPQHSRALCPGAASAPRRNSTAQGGSVIGRPPAGWPGGTTSVDLAHLASAPTGSAGRHRRGRGLGGLSAARLRSR